MWRFVYIVVVVVVLVGCGAKEAEPDPEPVVDEVVEEEVEPEKPSNQEIAEINTVTSDGFDRMAFIDVVEGISNEELGPEDLLELIESPEYLAYIPFPLVEVDTGDAASVMVGAMVDDAEDVEAFFEEHSDGDSFIRLDLDNRPIRVLSIPTKNVSVSSVLNFSPHVIHMQNGEAIVVDDVERDYWYQYLVSLQSEATQGADLKDYRTYDELSNVEQAFLPTFGKLSELIYQLIAIERLGLMDTEAAGLILEQFGLLADEMMMFPEPQTELDYQTYNTVNQLKPWWARVAAYDPNDPEYRDMLQELYNIGFNVSDHLNNVMLMENDNFYGAKLYIEAYKDM